MIARPELLTFDVFGTVLDWRRGLREALREHGAGLSDSEFDRVIDLQAELEAGRYRPYDSIVTQSLVQALGLPLESARAIGDRVGAWPLFPDSREALSGRWDSIWTAGSARRRPAATSQSPSSGGASRGAGAFRSAPRGGTSPRTGTTTWA